MVKILGCDPASSFGWVVLEDGEYVKGGAQAFKHPTPAKLRKGSHRGEKWGSFYEWFEALVADNQPDIIAYERVRRNASTLAAHAYGFFRYSIEGIGWNYGIGIYPLDVGSWKKLITTEGDASKRKAASDISLVFPGITFESEDHSDALGIAYSAHLMHSKDPALLEAVWDNNGGKKKKKVDI